MVPPVPFLPQIQMNRPNRHQGLNHLLIPEMMSTLTLTDLAKSPKKR